MGYTGHQTERESGLRYSVHRYLDPRNGRWLRRDPAGGVDGANLYRYVNNRPLSGVDSMGLRLELVGTRDLVDEMIVRMERLSGIDLTSVQVDTLSYNVEFEFPDALPAGLTIGTRLVRNLVQDCQHKLFLLLVNGSPAVNFGSYNYQTIDLADVRSLPDTFNPLVPSATTSGDKLVHELAEQSWAFNRRVQPTDANFDAAHTHAIYAENLYRRSIGATGSRSSAFSNGFVHGWRYSNGASTTLVRSGGSFFPATLLNHQEP